VWEHGELKVEEVGGLGVLELLRLVDLVPDVVHVLYDGRIVETGDKNLALKLEDQGYDWVIEKHNQEA
jgi:Fe-S cluster assembly ATP-binding protein